MTTVALEDLLGSVVQAYDSDLAAIAALSTTSYGRALLALADATAARTALALGTASTHPSTDFDAAGAAAAAAAASDPSGAAAAAQAESWPATTAFDATVPVTQALGDSAAAGSAAKAAHRDHKHGMPTLSSATPLVAAGAGAVGTGTASSREDHVHPSAGGGGSSATNAAGLVTAYSLFR